MQHCIFDLQTKQNRGMVLLCLELLTRLNGTIIQRITCIAACISAWYQLICTKKFFQKTVILIKYMYSVHKPTVGNSSASTFHSQQRRLVMKPSKLQRMISLFRFQPEHVIATLHNSNVKMASRVSWKLKFESKILVLTVKCAVNLLNIVMPGENCVMFGCGISRRTKGAGIWKLPNAKEDHKKMEGRLARGNYEDKRS